MTNISQSLASNMFVSSGGIVSDETTETYSWIVYILCEIVVVFGTATNIINIICFLKQGLTDPINVSFLGLAISDLGSLVFLIWSCICFLPGFQESGVPIEPMEFQYLTTGWAHVICTRATSWITALVTVERCLCITIPLKVKTIITPRLVTIAIACVFILHICGVLPIYFTSKLVWVFSSDRNGTMLRVIYSENRAIIEQISYGIVNVFSPFSSYGIVVVFTVVLVAQLRNKGKWRMKCTSPQKADAMLERDRKVAKMVVMISAIFIASCIPLCITFMSMIVEPKIAIDGEYKNLLFIFAGLSAFLETANSATNILIYYHMSTKYKIVFKQLFARK